MTFVAGLTFVANLTWDQVERRLAEGATAVLPVGAGAKEHGWHLPMQTDQIQAEWLAAQLAQRCNALIWPCLTYGYYPAFVAYAGSSSLSADVFEALLHELATSLLGYAPRLLILNTGISTIAPIERVCARLKDPTRALHVKIHDGPNYRQTAQNLATQTHGSHADELETSRMLVLAPERVLMHRAAASPQMAPVPGPMQHQDPHAPNYSQSGSIGDPRAATREKGEALLAAMVADMMAAVEGWLESGKA